MDFVKKIIIAKHQIATAVVFRSIWRNISSIWGQSKNTSLIVFTLTPNILTPNIPHLIRGDIMFTVSHEELQAILGQLQQAIHNHEEWFANLNRSVICRLPDDPKDQEEDAYRRCRFGQWLYGDVSLRLHEHPAFTAIETEHRAMHQYAARLLGASRGIGIVGMDEYDRFASSLQKMRFEIDNLCRELQESLYNLDPLTGACTRIGMLTKLREQHELALRGVQFTAVTMMDLDRFKEVNDHFGHMVGDQVLASAVHYLLEHLRAYDKVFRYGGEEFFIVLPATNINTARNICDRLGEEIAVLRVPTPRDGDVSITVSFGLTMLDPDVPVEQSIARADEALYAAKAAGRHCSRIWDPVMSG